MECQKIINVLDDKTNQPLELDRKLGWNKGWITRNI